MIVLNLFFYLNISLFSILIVHQACSELQQTFQIRFVGLKLVCVFCYFGLIQPMVMHAQNRYLILYKTLDKRISLVVCAFSCF